VPVAVQLMDDDSPDEFRAEGVLVSTSVCDHIQGGPQKRKPLPNDKKIVLNHKKPVNVIRFIPQIKV